MIFSNTIIRALGHVLADGTEDAVLVRETARHKVISITSELHVIQKNCVIKKDWKKIKKSSHLFCRPNTGLTVPDSSSQTCFLKHSLPKLGDRTHRFSFLTVEAESLLNQLKPITLAVTTGDMNRLVLYALQLLFTLLCLLSVFYSIN